VNKVAVALLAFVAVQRLGELVWARRNTRRLLARGGYEIGRRHYPLMVAVHAGWLVALGIGIERAGSALMVSGFWTLVFLGLQLLRVWVLATLGDRWTTRIIVVPGEPLVRSGPYRFLRHPNYAIVAAEIAALPMAFGFWWIAAIFSVLNALVLSVRLAAEAAIFKAD
jgi:methyltransferase